MVALIRDDTISKQFPLKVFLRTFCFYHIISFDKIN
jgi:hypothetical protein